MKRKRKEKETDTDTVNTIKQKERILIVEDNEDIRQYLTEELRGLFEVCEAANGEEAWKLLNESRGRCSHYRCNDACNGRGEVNKTDKKGIFVHVIFLC